MHDRDGRSELGLGLNLARQTRKPTVFGQEPHQVVAEEQDREAEADTDVGAGIGDASSCGGGACCDVVCFSRRFQRVL